MGITTLRDRELVRADRAALRRKSAETDGDLQIAPEDADRDRPGVVVAEIPTNRRGVKFARWFSVGRPQSSRFALALQES